MAKLDKILESMDSFKIDSEVALLENESLDALTVAQSKKIINESFRFIKSELIQGGILEETQTMIANAWTQAIMEDIYLPEDDGIGAGDVALGGAGAAAVGAGARYAAPAIVKGVNKTREFHNNGFDAKPSLVQGYRAAKQDLTGTVTNDINAIKDAAAQANLKAANMYADGSQAIRQGAFDLGRKVNAGVGKVKRIFAPQA